MRCAVVIAAATVLVPSSALAEEDTTAADARCDALVEQARAAYAAGKFREALDAERSAYACDPEPGLLYAMGQAAFNLGDYTAAEKYYTEFLATKPGGQEETLALQALAVTRERIATAKAFRPPPPPPRTDRVALGLAITAGATAFVAPALYALARQRVNDTSDDFATFDARVEGARDLRIAAVATVSAGAVCATVAVIRWRRSGKRAPSSSAIAPFATGDAFGLVFGGRL